MNKLIMILSLVLISGCATPGYQKSTVPGKSVGYSDQKIQTGIYRVTYRDVSREKAYSNFMLRAANLAKENGFSYFNLKSPTGGKAGDMTATIYGVTQSLALDIYEGVVELKASPGDGLLVVDEIIANFTPKIIAKNKTDE
jgi:hypothetical protein